MTATKTADSPQVYVGTYAKYNSGSIKGAWLSLEDYPDKEEFLAACAELHTDEADPEFMFQDYQNFPAQYYGESGLAEGLWDWLELDEDDREMMTRYQDAVGDKDATFSDARDAFRGKYASGAEAAEEMAEECGDVPKNFPSWIAIDWEATWDCNFRHDFSTSEDADGTLWIFHNH